MKRVILPFILGFATILVANAQVPQKFHYQAVVRDAQHTLISNQEVAFRLSILEGDPGGSAVYTETHLVTTSSVGLSDLMVGDGNVAEGSFEDISWDSGPYFLKVEADATGGSAFEHLGTSQLISVPYALYSANVSSPTRKFTIQEDPGHPMDSALFEVKNLEGQTVFAVYPDGTRVYVLDDDSKGPKGSFRVGGYSRKAKGETQEYMYVSPDSVRIYVDEGEQQKGPKGSFAVGGYSRTAKGTSDTYFELKPDNAQFTLVGEDMEGSTNALSVKTKPWGAAGDGTASNSLFNLTRDNYFIGHRAGESNTAGVGNSFIGFESGVKNTEGHRNIFIGVHAGTENLTGMANTFIGVNSGANMLDGLSNTFLGAWTGLQNIHGNDNVYIGRSAGERLENGYRNVFIGSGAGSYTTAGQDNIFIGTEAGYFNDSVSGKLIMDVFGRDSSAALIFGDFYDESLRFNNKVAIGMNPEADYALSVNGDAVKEGNTAWDVTSDRRVKTGIRSLESGLDQVMRLRPVTYRFSEEWLERHPGLKDRTYYSFVAQEFAEVFPESVTRGPETLKGDPETLLRMNSQPAQVTAIKAIQELAEQNRQQQVLIEDLLQKVENLEALISE